MKKFLTFILVLAMVMSVSSFAMAYTSDADATTGVASITSGSTTYYYSTLGKAVADAVAGDTIKLLKNITVSNSVTISKSITIDGGNFTLTYTDYGENARAIEIPNEAGAAEVTIKNLTVDCTADYCQRGISYNAIGKLNLDNVTVKGTNVTYALNLPGKANGCEVTINGGSYTGCIALNVWGKNSVINVTGTTLTSVDNAEEGYAVVKLNNNGGTSAEGTVINVEGGSINVTGSSHENTYVGLNPTVTGEIKISSSTTITGGGKANTKEQYVAIIKYPPSDNFYSYKTLAEAVAAAKDGDTITLLADCSGNGIVFPDSKFGTNGLTIDFNGHTYNVDADPLAGSPGTETQAFQILKGNKVTLKDGTLTSSKAKMLIQNYSDLTLENMILDGENLLDSNVGKYVLSNNSGNVSIEDTTINAPADGVAFDVCKYSSYTEPTVTVSGNSKINGKIEVTTTAQTNLQISGGEFSEKPDPAWVVDDKVAVGDDDGEGYVIDTKQNSASIHVAPASLDFGSKDYGYSAVGEKTFVITNDGNVNVLLAELKSDFFDIAYTHSGDLLVGQSVTVKVAPKNKLAAAKYAVPVNVVANYYPSGNTSATPEKIEKMVTLKFEVKSLSSGSGISVKYNGGNSFSTSNPSVPTGVEIDGVPVTFNGTGSNFSVGCISSDAKWVTVRWNSTSVTTNFTPDGLVECTTVSIPKTGGMSIWAAIAQFLGF